MFSNDLRRQAMERAWRTDEASLTGKVKLVQSEGVSKESGFLMYLPIYTKSSADIVEPSERTIQGFSYAPFF